MPSRKQKAKRNRGFKKLFVPLQRFMKHARCFHS